MISDEKLVKLSKEYVRSGDAWLSDSYSAHEGSFEAGYREAEKRAEILVEALENIEKIFTPSTNWALKAHKALKEYRGE